MANKSSYSYVNDNGKPVNGAAATQHLVYTVFGGVKEYNKAVIRTYEKQKAQELKNKSLFSKLFKTHKTKRFK